jgi:NLR family CARD domain-containing protein 3
VLLPNRSLIVLNLSENNLASEEGILAANLLEHN